jgi:hypothetical protein
MPLTTIKSFLIPRGTSSVVTAPSYEKPLLQMKHNAGQGDRSMHLKEIEWPKDLPSSGKQRELDPEAEMQRLAAQYGVELFRKCYPIDEMFIKAFEACGTVALPQDTNPIPDATSTPEFLIEEFLSLRVPSLGKAQALKLVEANLSPELLAGADAKAISQVTGLPINLIRSTIEAAKAVPAEPRGAPSAPSQFKPTKVEAPGLA